ncbi:MAG: aspartate-semialdehyde dehydrogenase, partial [Clostridiales bacterium]|nr:aspartate-semialdehyde dehydrogenase [Clostridiales bacterium]
MKKVNVAVVGATGLVGSTILKVMAERDFPLAELTLLASERSAGHQLAYRGDMLT